jgi:hypothetical protein
MAGKNVIWSRIAAWFASKGGFAHVCAALFTAGIAAYYAVPPFQALLNGIYNRTPAWAHGLILAGLGLYAWYKRTSSPQGAMEDVQDDRAKAAMKRTAANGKRP